MMADPGTLLEDRVILRGWLGALPPATWSECNDHICRRVVLLSAPARALLGLPLSPPERTPLHVVFALAVRNTLRRRAREGHRWADWCRGCLPSGELPFRSRVDGLRHGDLRYRVLRAIFHEARPAGIKDNSW